MRGCTGARALLVVLMYAAQQDPGAKAAGAGQRVLRLEVRRPLESQDAYQQRTAHGARRRARTLTLDDMAVAEAYVCFMILDLICSRPELR